jgi:NhaC family Na+:H+ antiporter
MSPLSDTTNLAPAMAGTDLFTHIRHMAKTTIPTMLITLILFFVIGLNYQTDGNVEDVKTISNIISSNFTLTPWLFLVPAIVIFMIIKKVPALPALLVLEW